MYDLFLGEIRRQCTFALISYNGVVDALNSPNLVSNDETKKKKELDNFWFFIQGFLIAVANISKILWPSRQRGKVSTETESRGIKLRQILSLNNSHPLLKERKFRNHFEHYDTRIEEWNKKSKDRVLIDSNIGNIEYPSGETPTTVAYMRNFDPNDFVLTFRDEKYSIKEVFEEISVLIKKIEEVQSCS
jgi:hypothetical protein